MRERERETSLSWSNLTQTGKKKKNEKMNRKEKKLTIITMWENSKAMIIAYSPQANSFIN